MTLIEHIDFFITEWINQDISNGFFDVVLPLIRNKYFWTPLYVFLALTIVVHTKRYAWLFLMGIVISVGIADQLSSKVLKPTIERVRPCNDVRLTDINVLAPCRNSFSFTSSHASNHFAVAVFFSLLFGNVRRVYKFLLIFWASAISIAQVYVGLHFFFDILCGAALGSLIAYCICKLTKYVFKWHNYSFNNQT